MEGKKSRGLSPFRNNNHTTSSPRGHRSRSLSPFRRLSSQESFTSNNKANNKGAVLVCHGSAHAIVFRDQVRLARKIIQEEEELEESSSGSDTDSSDNEGTAAFASMRQSIRQSIQTSLREEQGSVSSDQMIVKEINQLAHSMVPELTRDFLEICQVSERNVEIEGLHIAQIEPLSELESKASSPFGGLLEESNLDDLTRDEAEVVDMLQHQKCVVKTIKNSEWPTFLKRFQTPKQQFGVQQKNAPTQHNDIAPSDSTSPFNSFVTSTSLLPAAGRKMRCYGSNTAYNVGVVFALPTFESELEEEQAQKDTQTWSWPAGYAAKVRV